MAADPLPVIAGQLDVDEVVELVTAEDASPPAPALGAAADRFARNTLRKSKQTQRTYLSVYGRFTAHLAAITGMEDPPPSALSSDVVASYLNMLEAQGRSMATVRKERAALNRLTRHLQLIGAIDQTTALEILDVEAVTVTGRPRERPALDEETWRAVKDRAAARVLELSPTGRASAPVAARDLAIIICLGELGLRSEELRTLRLDDLTGVRAGSATPWLHVVGKGKRERAIPLPPAVQRPLGAWLDARPPETDWNPLLFPRLGRQRHDGAFPDAAQPVDEHGRPLRATPLSSTALVDIVAPIMRDAGVADEHCHPHVLRHTFATLYLRRRARDAGALTKLQELLGHASIETTRGYLHHTRDELERSMLSGERNVLAAAATARRHRNSRRAA
ncbi:MAG: tyrosine-type recombinase/integrase [Vicinamibacteria bacterium]